MDIYCFLWVIFVWVFVRIADYADCADVRGFEFVFSSLPSEVWGYFLKGGLDVKTTVPCSSVFSVSSVIQTKDMSDIAALTPTDEEVSESQRAQRTQRNAEKRGVGFCLNHRGHRGRRGHRTKRGRTQRTQDTEGRGVWVFVKIAEDAGFV